jgi:uncharacterized repeat protein (TIGR03803 family)
MTNPLKHSEAALCSRFRFLAFVLTLFCTLTTVGLQSANAQTYRVLHNFTGGRDGAFTSMGLTMVGTGNLFGTASQGGQYGYGSTFNMKRAGSAWTFSTIYSFQGGNDGYDPFARVIVGPGGSLYGTTSEGGGGFCNGGGCGTFFNLQPPTAICKAPRCDWTKTILYRFTGFGDGRGLSGDLLFDHSGNVFGTSGGGGDLGGGSVYELTPLGGDWTASAHYDFTESRYGRDPQSGVISDSAGKLYGTTQAAGSHGFGTVFELTPTSSGWALTVLYAFQGSSDGMAPIGGLLFDQAGNLYGTASSGGSGGGGTVFELTPSGGGWAFNLVYSFRGSSGPFAGLTSDAAGNLYGTTVGGGTYQHGSVFKLTPTNGSWVETDIYSFTGGSDGDAPRSIVTLDATGNLYGTTYTGGANDCGGQGCGVVWEITP